MYKTSLLALMIVAALLVAMLLPGPSSVLADRDPVFGGADDRGPASQPIAKDDDDDDDEEHEGEEDESLHEIMEDMASDYRRVRRQTRDASKNVETADLLAELAEHAVEAKGLLPEMLAEVPEDQRAGMTRTYRLTMIELATTFLQAEAAIIEGRNDDAWELVLAANEVKSQGHDLFLIDDE